MFEVAISLGAKLDELLTAATIITSDELRRYISEFEVLKSYIDYIANQLVDVESMWDELTNQQRDSIRKLMDVVYDADDVFDKFITSGARFSRKMSSEVKEINKKLNAFLYDRSGQFWQFFNEEVIRMLRGATSSHVDVSDIIIGRDKDKESIINMLLLQPIVDDDDDDDANNVRIVTIVGVAGLGKTALAQLVFNDDVIKQEFPDPNSRIWVSMSYLDEGFDLKTHLLDEVIGNKYFLVLDHVWYESATQWNDLKEILKLGERGSKVLITTRSMWTATRIGYMSDDVYLLQGLCKEDSWSLFERLAFTPGSEEKNHHELLEIGKNIVDKYYRIPLAIKMVANHLFGQHISQWQSFERSGPEIIGDGDNWIFPILKFSYLTLQPSERRCFRYCAIFPKDVRIRKEKIFGLWIAQGYVKPLHRDQSIEDAAEEIFLQFLDMSYFEKVARDEYGDIESFKIHNLMHDFAQVVGRDEICLMMSNVNCLGHNIRHVRHVGDGRPDISMYNKKIRSYVSGSESFIDKHINNWMLLRVLNLSQCDVKNLPDSISKLNHLRYLDLSYNKNLKILCDPITQLHNLETLDLRNCDKLTCMPFGMDNLTNIRVLPLFVVGNNISSERNSREGVVEDLEALCKVRGKICIKIGASCKNVGESTHNRGGSLKSMEFLKELRVEFADDATCAYNPEVLLDKLEPPKNIKGIILHNYKGKIIGRWGRADRNWATSYPHLVHIVIWKCGNLQQMPLLNKLPSLKTLSLFCLDSLEYTENATSNNSSDKEVADFFPSLESLNISRMEKLKGWWKGDDWELRLRFPCLLHLEICNCPNFMSFAPYQSSDNMTVHEFPGLCSLKVYNCPNLALNLNVPTVETLKLRDTGERLQITCVNSQEDNKRRHVEVDKVRHLKTVSTNSLTSLCIHGDLVVESLLEVEDAFQSCASSFRELEIRYCANLRQLSGLEHFTALKKLKLLSNDNLSISEDDEEPWKSFHQSLFHLNFDALPEMKSLPKGMQCLTTLQILELRWCENLDELPQWLSCLSSLQSLSVIHCPRIRFLPESIKELTSLKNLSIQHGCPTLFTRCKNPDGEDFPKIQHISNISIR